MPGSALGQTSPPPSSEPVVPQATSNSDKQKSCIRLEAAISDENYPRLEARTNQLIDLALKRRTDNDVLTKKGKHFHGPLAVAWAKSRDILELLTEFEGFEQSSEAGDVILDEKLKIKSKGSADYATQLRKDKIERDVYTAIMQVAEGLGCPDSARAQSELDQGTEFMKSLVGQEETEKTLVIMKDWCSAIKIDESTFEAKPMSVLETEMQSRAVVDALMKTDPVIDDIRQTVHKRYNRRSNLARVTAKVVNFGLSVTEYSPTIVSPISQVAWTAYIATQGGPEEAKLLQEVYFGKRFESRFKTLDTCADLAVNGHNNAIMTKNPALLAVSEWMIDRANEVHKMPIAAKPIQSASLPTPAVEIFDSASLP
ncbi:unnamed protein product [Sphagnum balticum]